MKNRPIPIDPDYNYKYAKSGIKQNDALLQSNHAFIDPRTGITYEQHKGSQSEPNDKNIVVYKTTYGKDHHIYNTLQPRLYESD